MLTGFLRVETHKASICTAESAADSLPYSCPDFPDSDYSPRRPN